MFTFPLILLAPFYNFLSRHLRFPQPNLPSTLLSSKYALLPEAFPDCPKTLPQSGPQALFILLLQRTVIIFKCPLPQPAVSPKRRAHILFNWFPAPSRCFAFTDIQYKDFEKKEVKWLTMRNNSNFPIKEYINLRQWSQPGQVCP